MDKAEQKEKQRVQKVLSSQITTPSFQDLVGQPLAVLLLLSLLATLIYSNTFSASFHFDDEQKIVTNTQIKNLSSFLDFSGSRYVGFLSFSLNYHLGRLNVFGYHFVNLLIHITNGFLVYILVSLLFRTPTKLFSRPTPRHTGVGILHHSNWVAFTTAILFVTHPIQTQAVTYIIQRFTSLAALFYFLSVLCYLKWRLAAPERRSRYLWYVGALGSTILAMKTKEISFTLPFMILLVEGVFFWPWSGRQWVTLIPFLLTLPIIPLSFSEAIEQGEVGFASETAAISRLDYLFTQFRVMVTYLRLLVFPVNQNLDYDYPIYHSFQDPPVLFSFLFLFCLVGLALYLLFYSPQFRLVGFGLLWFFLTLSVESSIIPIRDVIYEHRLYLPSAGFMLTASIVIVGLLHHRSVMAVIAVGVVVAIFSVATYERNRVWKDEITLWTDVVSKSPNKPRGYYNLGVAYTDQDRMEEAIQAFETAVTFLMRRPGLAQVKRDLAKAHNNLGYAYKKLGRMDEAIQEYKTTLTFLTFKPDLARAHYNLGLAYYEDGRLSEAVVAFEEAVKFQSDFALAHNSQGNAYKKLNRLNEAVQAYKTALTLDPNFVESYYNLGVIYYEQEEFSEAISAFKEAVRISPDYAQAYNNLGNVYETQGRLDEAVDAYKIALTLKSDYVAAYYNLGSVYYKQGKLSDAISSYKEAVKLEPHDARIHDKLGNVYEDLGYLQEAALEYQIVLKQYPGLVETHYNLGNVYHRMGRIQEATHEFKWALQIKPDHEKARRALESLP